MSRSWIMLAASAVAACLMLSPSSHSSDAAQSATVTVNFNKSRGPCIQPRFLMRDMIAVLKQMQPNI